jgi:hypothetical protein
MYRDTSSGGNFGFIDSFALFIVGGAASFLSSLVHFPFSGLFA